MGFFESTGNWIIALGKTLIHSIWIGLLLFSLVKIAVYRFAGASSRLRYRMAVTALVIYAGSVIALFFRLYTPVTSSPLIPPAALYTVRFINSQEPEGFNSRIIYTACSYIYFSGFLFVIIRSLFSLRGLRRLKRSGTIVQGIWMERFLLMRRNLGIKVDVGFFESNRIMVPALIGVFKPVILVPVGMLTSLPLQQVETILIHELHHLKRLDFLVNMFQMLAEGLFFYNPAVRSISKLIRIERENCCDDLVLQYCKQPLDYARALITIAEGFKTGTLLYPAAGGLNQQQLFNRIKRILNQSDMKKNIRERLSTLLLMVCGLAILLSLTGFSQYFSKANDDYVQFDTIPGKDENNHREAIKEALEDIDWDEIRKEIEGARAEALEGMDWEELKREMNQAGIYLDSVLKEMDFDFDVDVDINIDSIEFKKELKKAIVEIKDIDWEKIRLDIEKSIAELENIDFEEIREEVEKALGETRTE